MSLNWNFPYPSQRMPIFARNVVATSQPLASQAGMQMLVRGGNAVDAALATAITLTVVEPTSNGIGSDAFAIVWDGRELHGLNGSGRSPRAWSLSRFSGKARMPELGWDTVTVPGAVDAWISLSRRFGKLPFADLFEPAIRYAADGFLVTPITAAKWSAAPQLYADFPDFAPTFLPGGRAPLAGEVFRSRAMAETLRDIAESGGESFYRGALAGKIATHAAKTGGAITLNDLDEHRSEWVKTLSQEWQGVTLHELPPNGQGLIVLIALGLLEHLAIDQYPVDSADGIHLQIEAMKMAFAVSKQQIADPNWMKVQPASLLDRPFLKQKARSIQLERAQYPDSSPPSDGGTVYLTAADQEGMMVSYIQSNYQGFGSGIVIPGTGISIQNRGRGFSLEKGHPNCVAGGKRPFHTIIPGFVMKEGAPLMGFGVMGAHMQAQGHVQMMVRIIAGGQNPQAAADAPRWYVTEESLLALEKAFSPSIRAELERRGHLLAPETPTSVFGGAQLIYRLQDGYCAASDPRKDGQAVGF
ncbi:MAG: gamma-glutamyltransferase family protein [Deltaproteobacteria bacterium]|nr:gamma-glutamyltransferase family protein [Deltaproteobacteria bacterium]